MNRHKTQTIRGLIRTGLGGMKANLSTMGRGTCELRKMGSQTNLAKAPRQLQENCLTMALKD